MLVTGVKNLVLKPKYDFLDLGCKSGGSIAKVSKLYGGRGLGLDFKQSMVNKAIDDGHDAIQGDVLEVDFPTKAFRYISMIDFLEHLPGEAAVAHTIGNCKRWAREFFFIHHPSFEDVDYLKKHGFKLDWTDWSGHTSPLTIEDFKRIFKQLGLKNYKIKKTNRILDSEHEHIVPLSAPIDTVRYEPKLGPKKFVKFDQPVYSRVEMFVQL